VLKLIIALFLPILAHQTYSSTASRFRIGFHDLFQRLFFI